MQDNTLHSLEDAFAVFEKVPGTPRWVASPYRRVSKLQLIITLDDLSIFRYWLHKRYELLAKLEQLGPFQFFFTLR